MLFGCWCWCCFGVLLGVLFEVLVTVRAHFCEMDGRVAVWGAVRARGHAVCGAGAGVLRGLDGSEQELRDC